MNILLLCSGNTCRSPMAKALLLKAISEQTGINKNDFKVESAGLWAQTGFPASPEAVKVMSEYGLDLSAHRSRAMSKDLARQADLILTMTRSGLEEVQQRYPFARDKSFTLADYAGFAQEEIIDPFGSDLPTYRQTAQQLRKMIHELVKKL